MATRLRCEHGEWKTRDQFSNSQLAKYDEQARKGRATPTVTGIRCNEHSSKQALELKCKGPCGRWRELGFFSRNSRRNGKNWCIDCTDWHTKSELGEALPTPGGQLSIEETARSRVSHVVPMHSIASGSQADVSDRDDAETTYAATVTGSLAPSSRALSDNGTMSFASGAGAAPSTSDARLDDRTSVASGPRGGEISYNAWGPNGEYARLTKTPTVVSGSTTVTKTTAIPENLGRKGWAKPPTRRQPAQLPDYLKYDVPLDDDDDGLDLDSDDDF
ncbi:hypothetical protein VTI74DRAFT_7196 [Chaetomium olivicolor]